MAITTVSVNNYTTPKRWLSQVTGDLSGCEIIKAAVTGQSHYVTKIIISSSDVQAISFGEGESSSDLVTTHIGPIYLPAGGLFVLDISDNPIQITAATLIAADSNDSHNATVIVEGFTM
jgi:hypothetical protein